MADRSGIEWTDATWNPVTGCSKVSPGCAHCYAEAITLRFKRGPSFLPSEHEVVLHPDRLDIPKAWKLPRRIFVCSMADLLHEDVPVEFIHHVLWVIRTNPRHTFQVLTKRAARMTEVIRDYTWSKRPRARPLPNLWLGVSVENARWKSRIAYLRATPAAVRFLSCEPLIGSLGDLELEDGYHLRHRRGIDWVIVGGESGPRARPMRPEWARDIHVQCEEAGVPFFFKQWGGRTPKAGGRLLAGVTWDEMPVGKLST